MKYTFVWIKEWDGSSSLVRAYERPLIENTVTLVYNDGVEHTVHWDYYRSVYMRLASDYDLNVH